MLAVATALDVKKMDLRRASSAIKQAKTDHALEIRNASGLHGLCAGLKEGTFVVAGDAGDYLGVLNDGATIRVTGNAGQYVGDSMTHGLVVVEGNAGTGAGVYPYGGTVVVRGDAGDYAGTMNKGATIVVGGNVGDEAATFHLAGDFVVLGNAGANFGNAMIGGSLYVGGEVKSQGHNTRIVELAEEDTQKLSRYLSEFGLKADPAHFRKIVAATAHPHLH